LVYQLPNGKVIQITIEQYLDLTDEDIQYLMSINYGDYATSPWLGSTLSKKRRKKEVETEEIDTSIDYSPEDEDKSHGDNMGIEEISLDECPDVPDESTQD
jgi:hypothetical protein